MQYFPTKADTSPLEEIEISQCVENPQAENQSTKYLSHGTKASVMAAHKLPNPRKRPDADAEQVDDEDRVRFLMDSYD